MNTRIVWFIAAAAGLLLEIAPAGPIDFTPVTVRSIEDGIPVTRTAFKDGETRFFFRPAKGWRLAGSGTEVTMYPTDQFDAYIRLGNGSVGPKVPFDEAGLKAYEAAAWAALPQDAEDVKVLSQALDPYPLDDWKSFEMRFEYELFGTRNICWVLFITMNPDRQIWYVVDANQRDFDAVYKIARSMLGSWFEPPPGWPPALP